MEIKTELLPRYVALLAAENVLARKIPLEEAWNHIPEAMRLEGRDREFAWLLVMSMLRHLLALTARYSAFLDRPLPPKHARAGLCLLLGAAQLLVLKTPAHAAVHTSVDLASALQLHGHTGLINAVLKKVAATADAPLTPILPEWLRTSWEQAYGKETTQAIAMLLPVEPPLDLSVRSDAEGWARRLGGGVLPTGTVRLRTGGSVTLLEGFGEGRWWVQDMAAALPVKLLGEVAGRRVLDLCAAPGGKTMQLAAAGALVTAVERSPVRMRRLEENLNRLSMKVECVEADVMEWSPSETFESILLDAPCSATGTFRKHPEVLWLRRLEDVERLRRMQLRMLRRVAKWLTPGGRLVYCVCSLQPEEGERQVADFLASHADFRLDEVAPEEVGGLTELITDAGALRTLPCHLADKGGMDGFYAARLIKT